jgi:LysM repeat protein
MLEPWEAFSQTLTNTGYRAAFDVWVPRKCPIGIGGKRCREDGTDCSLHNYGVAVDVDPPLPADKVVRNGSANPIYGSEGHWRFGDIKLTAEQVAAVRAIRSTGGSQVFDWLGDSSINDTMHFEVQVPPTATRVDWHTVPGRRRAVPVDPTIGDGRAATYIVQRGDTFTKIASRFAVTVTQLVSANPQIPDPDKIFPGQLVTLPGKDGERKRIRRTVRNRTFIVQRGDTLVMIAERFEIATVELIAANPQITDPARIFPGQVIRIPR